MNKKLFFELLRKRFCRETMQRTADNPCSKTVAGKNTVIYLKEIRIGRMPGYRKTFDGKTGN